MKARFLIFSFVLPAGLLAASLPPVEADPWPRFRGPNGTGVCTDKGIPLQWTEREGVLWKVPIPGLGNSSPIIWGDRLFLQTSPPSGKERLLLCLDVADGKVLWRQSVPAKPAKTHQKNTTASSTPATDGERVYALFWDGEGIALYAYDFSGKQLWATPLGGHKSQHGAGISPVVYRGKVYLNNDQDDAAALIALDARTGKPVWEVQRKAFRACYSSPFLLEKPGEGAELIVSSTAGVTSYDPDTGRENWNLVWTFPDKPLRTVGSPVYGQGIVIACSGDGGGDRHCVAVKVGGKGDVSQTHLAWEKRKAFPYVPTLVTHGEHVYYVTDLGVANCVAIATGETIWSERLGGNFSASPILIDGKVYAINEEGVAYVFGAAPSFQLLAKSSVGEGVIATPAAADNRLFIRGREHLLCIGKPGKKGGVAAP